MDDETQVEVEVEVPGGPALLWAYAHHVLQVADHPNMQDAVISGYYLVEFENGTPVGIHCGGRYWQWEDPVVQGLLEEYERKVEADRQAAKARAAERPQQPWEVQVLSPEIRLDATTPFDSRVERPRWMKQSRWRDQVSATCWADHLANAVGQDAVRVRYVED